MKNILLTLILFVGFSLTSSAVPADPTPIKVKQPDGTTLTVRLRGDEFFHFHETLDGVPLARNAKGGFCYAKMRDGRLVPSEILAHDAAQRPYAETLEAKRATDLRSTFNSLAAEARSSHYAQMAPTTARKSMAKTGRMYNWKGQKTGLVILVQFADLKMRSNHTRELFERQFNEKGFNFENASGSVYDYFYAQSQGQFELTMDVVGPVTMPNNLAYYGANSDNDRNIRVREMVAEAFRQADEFADFTKYDWNNDGYVDNVFLVYAGYDESYSGNSEDYIWAHQWATQQPVLCDGVYAQQYACASEMFGWEQQGDTKVCGIGTACHEMAHTLGLSDLYDVDYSGANHPESWSLMSGGGHLSNGQIPSNLTAYERVQLGWLQLKELTEDTNVTDMPSLSEAEEAYVVYNPAYRNEFYVLENRQKKGFDSAQGGHGLMVFHIDFDKQVWDWNQPNDDIEHPRYVHIPAGGDYQNAASSPFPGTAKMTELTDYSHPTATLYNPNMDGQYKMHCSFTSITERDGKISFNFTKDAELKLPKVVTVSTANRGSWAVDAEGKRFTSTKEAGIETKGKETTPRQMQFILSEQDGKTYLYSLYAQKFVNPDLTLSVAPESPLTLRETQGGTKVATFAGNRCVRIDESGMLSIHDGETEDEGSTVTVEDARSDVFTAWSAARGGWAVNANGTRFVSSTDAGLGTMANAFSTQLQFRLVDIEGASYLYSMHAHKYVSSTGTLSATPRNPIILTPLEDGSFIAQFDDTHVINLNGDNQISISNWNTPDEGNMMTFEAVPLEMTVATVHWKYAIEGNPYKEFDNYLERNLNVKDFAPDFYKVNTQSLNNVGTSITADIEVNGTEDLPFAKDAWMLLRTDQKLMRIGNASVDCSNIHDWEAVSDDDNLWSLSGNLAEGFTLHHKGTDSTPSDDGAKWIPVKTYADSDPKAFSLKSENSGKFMAYDADNRTLSFTGYPSNQTSIAYQPVGYACNRFLEDCIRIPEGAVGKPEIIDDITVRTEIVEASSLMQDEANCNNLDMALGYIELCKRITGSKRHAMTDGFYYLVADNTDTFGALHCNNGTFAWNQWEKHVDQVCRISPSTDGGLTASVYSPNHSVYLLSSDGKGGTEPANVLQFLPVTEEAGSYHYGHHLMKADGQQIFAQNTSEGHGILGTEDNGNCTAYWYIVPATTMSIKEAQCTANGIGFVSPYLPFAVKVPENCSTETLYRVTMDADGTTATLTEIEAVAPHTGFICSMRDIANADNGFLLEILNTEVTPVETCLKGSLSAVAASEFDGALLTTVRGKLGFSKKNNVALPSNTAYMETDASFLQLNVPSDGIHEIKIDSLEENAFYNLSGQRITHPQHGHLYICNGRKIIFIKQ